MHRLGTGFAEVAKRKKLTGRRSEMFITLQEIDEASKKKVSYPNQSVLTLSPGPSLRRST